MIDTRQKTFYTLTDDSATDEEILELIRTDKDNQTEETRIRVPVDQRARFENYGFCTDGVRYEENGAWYYTMHRSYVFDDSELLQFGKDADVILTRTRFSAPGTVSAKLQITALGYFEAFINGIPVSEDRLIPPKSDYLQRDLSGASYPIYDTMSHRIYYYEYDVTSLIRTGANVLATQIGNGWFGDGKNKAEGMKQWGDKCLIFRILLTNAAGETVFVCSSAENTVWHKSHILESSLYYGEYHNYLQYITGWDQPETDDSDWSPTAAADKPLTFFHKADFPADADCGTITPLLLKKYGDHRLYDLGETAAGWPVIRGTEEACRNVEINLRYTDMIAPDLTFALRHTGGNGRAQTDRFVLSDETAHVELHPRLLWHAARYVEVSGPAELVAYIKIQSPVRRTATFKSDSRTLNWFFSAYVHTQETNIHGMIPSDCPHRERLGYTGDGQLTCGAVMSVFDARQMYRKWMRDIRDCQDIDNGHVQHTAPFFGGGGGPGGWGGAAVIVPYRYYKFYKDKDALRLAYPSMKAYISYMREHCSDNIVTHEEPDGWCLGDWCPPKNKILIPEAFVNTYFFAKCAAMCRETALILGQTADAPVFDALYEDLKDAIMRHYFDPETGSFCEAQQGADAFAVDLGIGDERTLKNLVTKYSGLGTFDTGIFGTDILLRVLFRHGYGRLAFSLWTNEEENSFYNMMKSGSRNLWENWDGCDSLCHPMFGAPAEYLFSEILGIRRYNDNAGYEHIVIEPANIPELKNVSGTMETPWGKITVIIGTDSHGRRNVSYFADPGIHVHNP